jgi:DNA-binding transcriptional ArsR family regulator
VVRREADGYTCYFRPGTDPREREALARLRSPTAEAILSALCSGNHDSQRAVARALDLAPSTVSYHVGRLRDAGLLADEEHEGRRVTPLAREILARLDRQ